MSNKIDSPMVSSPMVSSPLVNTRSKVSAGAQESAVVSKTSADTASAEKPSLTLSSVNADLSAPINSARVQALQAQIAEGTYQPNAEAIASAMIQMDRELFQ
jgi:flagellar biosynthesis anti-sigma factor FlgM